MAEEASAGVHGYPSTQMDGLHLVSSTVLVQRAASTDAMSLAFPGMPGDS